MMGFGSSSGNNNNGFSAASSNLSPLAPPFTVTSRSVSALNINATPFGTNWGNSHGSDYQPTPVTETVSSAYYPHSTVYSVVAPSAKPQIDHVPYFSSPMANSIQFAQYPSGLMNNDLRDGDYYADYPTWDKSLVIPRNELGYKSSSAQDTYTQSLYGLQYPNQASQWDYSWDAQLDIESGGKTSYVDGIAPKAPNCINAPAYSDFFKEDSELPKVMGKPSDESRARWINNATTVCNPIKSWVTDAVVDKPFEFCAKEIYVSTVSTIPSRTCEISLSAAPDKSILEPWSHVALPNVKNGMPHKQPFINDIPSVPSFFNEVTSVHPYVATSSEFSDSQPPQNNVTHKNIDLSGNSDDMGYDRLFDTRDPWLCLKSTQEQEIRKHMDISTSSTDTQRYDSGAMLFPTKYGEPSGLKSMTNVPLVVRKPKEVADVHGNIHDLEGFSLIVDESDQYNPSEDSPCWKGSSSYFTQFQASEAIPSQHHLKNLNSCDGLELNEPQTFSLGCTFPATVFSNDSHEKTTNSTNRCLREADSLLSSVERGHIGNRQYDESNSDAGHTALKFGAAVWNSSDIFGAPYDNHITIREEIVEMEPPSVKKPEPPNPVRLSFETICCGSDKEKAAACTMNFDVNLSAAPEECQSNVPSNATKQVLSSLSSDADISSSHNQDNWDGYATKSKSMLLKTIVNLSDSLLFYYLNDENPVGNDDYKTLEIVLGKLTTCLKHAQEKSCTIECSIQKQGPSNVSNEVEANHNVMNNEPQISKANYHVAGATLGSNFEVLHRQATTDGTGEVDGMTEAIKDILDANFNEDTKSNPLATIYKNLWLEAEAALCSTNYKARYNRMKTAMENFASAQEKEKSLECKTSPTNVEIILESPSVDKSVHAADVIERYNILKCRVETANKSTSAEVDSSKILSAHSSVDKSLAQVSGFATSETIKGANNGCEPHDDRSIGVPGNPSNTILTNTYNIGMAEDPVMSRLRILKKRGDYPEHAEPEQQQSEFPTGKRGCEEVLNRRFKPIFEAGIPKATTVTPFEDGFEGVEYVSGSIPNSSNSEMGGLGVQFYGGWYENTASDWEHVLKDEYTWTGGAANP